MMLINTLILKSHSCQPVIFSTLLGKYITNITDTAGVNNVAAALRVIFTP